MYSMKSGDTAREELYFIGIEVHFCWIPEHVGIEGNKTVDILAKSALNKNENNIFKLCFGRGEIKSIIHQGVMTNIAGNLE